MEVRNCKQCGRLYNYIGGSYRNLCPDCIAKVEEKFGIVKEYIQEHKEAGIHQVSAECEVSVRQIEQWIREERLCFTDDSPIGIACENCGKTIKTGRYCDVCKAQMINQFGNMYSKPEKKQPKKSSIQSSSEKMRFLDQ